MKQAILVLPLIVALAGCGQKSEREAPVEQKKVSALEESAAADADMPAINASVAPGVAFSYDYGFSIAEMKIARLQEAHAAQCAKLGLTKCRVTGLNFTKERGGSTEGWLSLKLDPAIALAFAREATGVVEKEGGKLEASQVTGTDEGGDVVRLVRGADEINVELARVTEQLKSKDLSDRAKTALVEQDGALRGELRALSSAKAERQETLATAPMTIRYEVGETILGFDRQSTIGSALLMGQDSIAAMLAFFAMLIGGLGPWVLLALGVFWLWKRFGPKRKAMDVG